MKIDETHWQMQPQDYGVMEPYVFRDDITDVDYNGKELWVSSLSKGRYCVKAVPTVDFVEQFCSQVANIVSHPFNKNNPVIEAETRDLRITIVHESVAMTGTNICIRKTPTKMRLSVNQMLESGYCNLEILYLLACCVTAGLSIAVCGGMGSGKTELLKFLTRYIPDNEKTITIEDTMEVHFRAINPGKDCISLKVDEKLFQYEDALKASLRLNAERILLSEARSSEVQYLLENMSIGTGCLTTLHADDVRRIPERIKNMFPDTVGLERVENEVYTFLHVGILLRRKQDEDGRIRRFVDQVGFFSREGEKNVVTMVVEDRNLLHKTLPEQIKKRMRQKGILEPFNPKALPTTTEQGETDETKT
jgi:pilus assembly protein CpaF